MLHYILSPVLTWRQVGLIALAIVVTRSSVASLQAKQGLPLGTQVLGWITLSKFFPFLSIPHISLPAIRFPFAIVCEHLCISASLTRTGIGLSEHNRATQLSVSAMAIFPQNPEEVYDMLEFLENPQTAFYRLSFPVQCLLVTYMTFCYPAMFLLGLAWEICWRLPRKSYHGSAFKPEKDVDYLQGFLTKTSPIRNLLVFLLHHEVRAGVLAPTQKTTLLPHSRSTWMRPTRSWSTSRSQRTNGALPVHSVAVVGTSPI